MINIFVYLSRIIQLVAIALCFIICFVSSLILEGKIIVKPKSLNEIFDNIFTIEK